MQSHPQNYKKKFIRSRDFSQDLRSSIYKNGLGQDFTITCKNGKFYAYSSILMARSPGLANLQSGTIDKKDNHYSVVEAALKYIYTNDFDMPFKDPYDQKIAAFDLISELYKLANDWALPEVKIRCERYLTSEMRRRQDKPDPKTGIKNRALNNLSTIKNMSIESLTNKVLEVIDKEINIIIENKDYLKIDDTDLAEILQRDSLNITNELSLFEMIIDYAYDRYSKNNENKSQSTEEVPQELKDHLRGNLLKLIRFSTMSLEDFMSAAEYEILDTDEVNDIADYIEAAMDGDRDTQQQILEDFKEHSGDLHHWFKKKRFYFDQESYISGDSFDPDRANSLVQESLKSCKPSIEQYKDILTNWTSEEIYNKIQLRFISTKDDSFTCKDFHYICDNKSNVFVIIKSCGAAFGGFTSVGWSRPQAENEQNEQKIQEFEKPFPIEDENAFLFILSSNNQSQQKIPIVSEQKKSALIYYSQRGPIFGDGWDLSISGDLKTGFSNSGFNYKLPNNIQYDSKDAKMFFTNEFGQWAIEKLEVYF
ncbi:hypothetical protein M0811_09760 [Anaeramoeba ignava]|uniref:BTB domain-containing protein n=1 Tax=Anaeramoeba ignava TaxID=1746090 RepID=A0A9Q0R9G8_ANAIG|nr:hypothetical protein M0811_09760 [Anaeramoeba ignava]